VVATAVPTTHGMPYSRLTTAVCARLPPVSVTQPATIPNAGVHSVVVPPQTRISPDRIRSISWALRNTRAGPTTTPREAA